MDLIYKEDSDLPTRKSHDNPQIKEIYSNFFKHPLSHLSHKLLHTHYKPKPIEYSSWVDMSEESAIKDNLAKRFPEKRKDLLVEMLISEVDRSGFVSDCGIVTLAKYANVQPIEVASIASGYMYIPRTKVGENQVFLCHCLNCQLHGLSKARKHLEKLLNCKIGKISQDGKFSLHKANWLGWCVNNSPAVMIKSRGTDYVVPILNVDKIQNPEDLLSKELFPKDNLVYIPYTRFGEQNPSFLKPIDLQKAIDNAFSLGPEKVIKELADAGLQGRGGAGFKTALKWKSARNEKADQKYVVCNIDEGLPCTFKDWTLLMNDENRKKMIAGMAICANTIGAKHAFLYLRFEYRNLKPILEESIEEIKKMRPEFADIKFEIRLGAGPYVGRDKFCIVVMDLSWRRICAI